MTLPWYLVGDDWTDSWLPLADQINRKRVRDKASEHQPTTLSMQ